MIGTSNLVPLRSAKIMLHNDLHDFGKMGPCSFCKLCMPYRYSFDLCWNKIAPIFRNNPLQWGGAHLGPKCLIGRITNEPNESVSGKIFIWWMERAAAAVFIYHADMSKLLFMDPLSTSAVKAPKITLNSRSVQVNAPKLHLLETWQEALLEDFPLDLLRHLRSYYSLHQSERSQEYVSWPVVAPFQERGFSG